MRQQEANLKYELTNIEETMRKKEEVLNQHIYNIMKRLDRYNESFYTTLFDLDSNIRKEIDSIRLPTQTLQNLLNVAVMNRESINNQSTQYAQFDLFLKKIEKQMSEQQNYFFQVNQNNRQNNFNLIVTVGIIVFFMGLLLIATFILIIYVLQFFRKQIRFRNIVEQQEEIEMTPFSWVWGR